MMLSLKAVCKLIIIAVLLSTMACSVKYKTKDGYEKIIGLVFMKQKSHEKPCMIYNYSENIGVGLDFTSESGGFHLGRKQVNTVYLLNNASLVMRQNGANMPQFHIDQSLSDLNNLLPECHPVVVR